MTIPTSATVYVGLPVGQNENYILKSRNIVNCNLFKKLIKTCAGSVLWDGPLMQHKVVLHRLYMELLHKLET